MHGIGLLRLLNLFTVCKHANVIDPLRHLEYPVPPMSISSCSVDDMYHNWNAANHQLSVNRQLPPIPKNAEPAFIPFNPIEQNYGLYNMGLYI